MSANRRSLVGFDEGPRTTLVHGSARLLTIPPDKYDAVIDILTDGVSGHDDANENVVERPTRG